MNTVSIPEVLKAIGASGGEEIEDAASIAQEPSEKEVKETEKQTGQPQMPQMPQQPGMEPDMGMGQMPLAAGLTPKIYCILYENMFGDPTFGKPRKPGRRTGKYWKPIERITGKNRAKINDKDILSKRKEYARKPENEDRNKVLRSLDRAFDYFYDKIEETSGRQSAERYAEDYHAIDNLNPKDYSLEKHEPEPIGPEEPLPETSPDEINGPDFVDFADVLSRDDDSYEDIEIEEETY